MKNWLSHESIKYGVGLMTLASLGLLYMMSTEQVRFGDGVPLFLQLVYCLGAILNVIYLILRLKTGNKQTKDISHKD